MTEKSGPSTLLTILVALAVLVPLLGMLVMMPVVGMWSAGHMPNGGMWDGRGTSWLWLASWLVVVALVAGGGYLLYRAVSQSDDDQVDPALEGVRLAYARGELTDEEFEQRRERLEREE